MKACHCCRTDISRLAKDVAVFCLYRHCCHAAFPAKHLAHESRHCERADTAAPREATWCDFLGHQHTDVASGLSQVFSGPAVDYQGEVPRKQRHRDISVASSAGSDGDISVR